MKSLSCLLFYTLFSCNCYAQLMGEVISISDGDTFTLLTDSNKQVIVRLLSIDCPEKKQPYGNVAKEYLSGLIFGKTVTVVSTKKDRYARMLGLVIRGDDTINYQIIRAGLAWQYKRYDNSAYINLMETSARLKKSGLWADPYPTPPWDYRRGR